jgi:phosphoserine phosphatase RsbU/P
MDRGVTWALVVDDNKVALELLTSLLGIEGYHTVEARDGNQAWEILVREPDGFDVVLLDRMMPNVDGMEVMARIKAHPTLRNIPVIMQTAASSVEAIAQGIEAGVYYYLTKPFDAKVLLSITRAAVSDHGRRRRLRDEVRKRIDGFGLMATGTFHFRTIEEANNLAVALASACPDPRAAVIGLSELLVNAVEHGNLSIGYVGKSRLIDSQRWHEEVEDRLSRPENRSKLVTVNVERRAEEIVFTVIDQGEGFDWRKYLQMAPERAFESHGRGIALAWAISFDRLEYRGRGNEVVAAVACTAGLPENGS